MNMGQYYSNNTVNIFQSL